ncbi:hypothetical protein [Curtobacterium sp. UCD-KPL2560]|uniref:hypothetical protein n=1 Tax=Curtobacterium sp. UCD-KPL2560 TaxID=1885315 RepID=UPI000825C6AD|nr:hypothetical protein [Curtobacterium sp. UCD-KPL2560]
MSTLVAHRSHTGTLSARKPADLRTELDRAIVPASAAARASVTATVKARCGEQAAQVLAMLGLPVAS